VDFNNDGKLDLIAGDTEGNVTLFLNVGTAQNPELAKGVKIEADGKPIRVGSHNLADRYSKIHMADWDGDGRRDLLVGHSNTIVMYKNVGRASEPRFAAPVQVAIPGTVPTRPSPYVVDWDGDGKKDLLVGCESAEVLFYRNTGTDKKPRLANGQKLELRAPKSEAGYRWRIDVTDWNNDGKLDLLVGSFYSGSSPSDRKMGGNVWLFLGK